MAIIRSAAIGTARGSLGIITYRTVRGRTIGSQKRGGVDPSTRAEGDTPVQFVFGLMARYAAARAADINNSFSATKYGSPRNAFMKLNFEGFKAALTPLYQTGIKVSQITDEELNTAVHDYATANPFSIYRAKIDGEPAVYLNGVWESGLLFGTITAATIDGKSLADNVRLTNYDVESGSVVTATLHGFDNVTLLENPAFLELEKSGVDTATVIQLSDVSVSQSGEDFVVSGNTSSAIATGVYTSFRVCVRHEEGVGELSNKIFSNVEVYTSSNPL